MVAKPAREHIREVLLNHPEGLGVNKIVQETLKIHATGPQNISAIVSQMMQKGELSKERKVCPECCNAYTAYTKKKRYHHER